MKRPRGVPCTYKAPFSLTILQEILNHLVTSCVDGFGGLAVSMLASGTRIRGSNPAEAVGFFRRGKNPQACLPSEGK
jgi:hypothetical protein